MRRAMTALGAAAALLVAATALGVPVTGVPNPRVGNGWVSDTIDVIDVPTEQRMNALIDAADRELGVEIAVVTVESVDAPTTKDFATDLFAHWGIGKAGRDTGLLILLVRGERTIEIETGYGLEAALTDGWLWDMQGEAMLPHFKEGRYGAGLMAGLEACLGQLRARKDLIGTRASAPVPGAGGGAGGGATGGSGAPWGWLGFGGLGVVGVWGWRRKHRRDRTCPTCQVMMTMVPDTEDDERLDAGQRTEEALQSVDYEIWDCATCDHTRTIRLNKWLSGRSRCPSCGYKTRRVDTRTITPATYDSSGLAEVTESCAHCDYSSRRTRTLPRKTRSTTSSSGGYRSSGSSFGSGSRSSGSSFGGGRSGGGGSSRRW